jgi:hypothetical protein
MRRRLRLDCSEVLLEGSGSPSRVDRPIRGIRCALPSYWPVKILASVTAFQPGYHQPCAIAETVTQ